MKNDPGPLRVPQASASPYLQESSDPPSSSAGLRGFSARRYLLPFFIALLLLITAGCPRPPGPIERPPAAPFDLSKLKERSGFWRDYQSKFRLRVDSQTTKFSSRAIIFVKGRDCLRFETFTPFGQTAALYVFNETGPELLIPSQKVIFTARRAETLVHEFLGVTLPADLFHFVLAALVPPEQLDHIESRLDAGVRRLVWNRDGSYFEWQVRGSASPALEGAFIRSTGFEGRVTYDPPVPLTQEAVPEKIRISSSEWNMEVKVEELKPTSQFQPSAFTMPNLPGIRKVDLDTIK